MTKTEAIIAKNPQTTYLYVRDVDKNFEGINAISRSSKYSYLYIKNILRKRQQYSVFEKAISKSAEYSYFYAKDVVKGRFELGEKAISKSARYSCDYASYVLKHRFELGETAISRNGFYSYLYAREVLNCRFQLAEPTFLRDIDNNVDNAFDNAINYARESGRFELFESRLIESKNVKYMCSYLTAIRCRWKEVEDILKKSLKSMDINFRMIFDEYVFETCSGQRMSKFEDCLPNSDFGLYMSNNLKFNHD